MTINCAECCMSIAPERKTNFVNMYTAYHTMDNKQALSERTYNGKLLINLHSCPHNTRIMVSETAAYQRMYL